MKAGRRYHIVASHLTGWRTNDNEYTTATSPGGPWSACKPGDRWNPNDLGDSRLIWLSLTINRTKVSLSWRDSWSIDTATGSWS